MSRTQLILCLFGISASLYFDTVQGRLEGEGIIGGDDAEEGQFPYQISLESYGYSFCGGSILSERFVITAAHCVTLSDGLFSTSPLRVVGGINDLNSKNGKHRVAVDVVEVFIPRDYKLSVMFGGRSVADIAILKLNKDLDIKGNPYLGAVKLPKRDETYAGKKAIISGFGYNDIDIITDPLTGMRDEANGRGFDKMRYAEANVWSYEECDKSYTALKITKHHLCAALVQRDEDQPEGVCSGDSGGPLVYNGAQIGVVSTSPLGCRENSKPAVYTRVSDYLDFVNKVIDGNIDNTIRSTTLRISKFG